MYVFWWTGELGLLRRSICDRALILKGPHGRLVELEFNPEWLGIEAGTPIPLYVGKTAAGVRKRVPQHLMLARERLLPLGNSPARAQKPTTSCQLRAGIEHIFPSESNTRDLVLDNVGLSYVGLDGDVHASNRFYLENMAIGLMRPVLNVDVER